MTESPAILITNDDGIHAEGLIALAESLRAIGTVWIVAPQNNQSSVGHSLTLHRPLRAYELGEKNFAVDGTPTDCVSLAVNCLMDKKKPALLVSGINMGGNMGDDITYSGTVSAAWEGTLMGIPSFAISVLPDEQEVYHFQAATDFALRLARAILEHGLPLNTLLNVNVPNTNGLSVNQYKITRQGKRIFDYPIVEKIDPRGKKYYWLGGEYVGFENIENSDLLAVHQHYISITPIFLDLTNYEAMEKLSQWKL